MNEWEFINLIKEGLKTDLEKSIGDDCAVIKKGDLYILLTKDLMVENTHFILKNTPIEYIGEKLVDANVSDIIAMGGTPKYALLGIVFPKKKKIDKELLIKGIKKRLDKYSINLIGGDTVSGEKLTLSMTIIGETKRYIPRDGAESGDKILISGILGYSRAGLNEFLKKGNIENKTAKSKYFHPACRYDILPVIKKNEIDAMIDISDGFYQDILHILKSSGKGAEINLDKFPVTEYLKDAAKKEGIELYDFILNSGEEYELITIVSEKNKRELIKNGFTEVGEITENREIKFFSRGKEKKISNLSFTHCFD